MGRSLGLAAYRALSWRKAPPAPGSVPDRPPGEVLWVHAGDRDRLAALGDLAARLRNLRPDLVILATGPFALSEDEQAGQQFDFTHPLDGDHPGAARQFLDHWRPDMCIWTGGTLLPNLVTQSADRAMPMVLADIRAQDFPARRSRWLPDPMRDGLDCFAGILVEDTATADQVNRLGVPQYKITVAGRLRSCASPAPVSETDLVETTRQLGSRPVWLAVQPPTDETADILAAHRGALRYIHRLLLVIALPADADRAALAQMISRTDLRHADWMPGDRIDDMCQVLVVSAEDDLGLWLRAAPVSFMAGSLGSGPGAADPMEAASLGSALLHGPGTGRHAESYDRLRLSGAARLVQDADSLGAAVIALSAPDTAASMALAAWQVVTDNAQLTDALIDMAQDMLDSSEVDHARP